jgi:hypothetical protein
LLRQGILNGVADTASVALRHDGLSYGKLTLETGINETVGSLSLNGSVQAAGTYGSSLSSATFKDDNYFSGTGVLTVVPVLEPAMGALLGTLGLAMCARRSRAR